MKHLNLLLLVLIAAALLACSAKAKFEPYISQAGRFQVLVPERLNYTVGEQVYLDARVVVHGHTVTKNGLVHTVNYFDLPDDLNASYRRKGGPWSRIPGVDIMVINNGWIVENAGGPAVYDTAGRSVQAHRFTVVQGDTVLYVQHVWHRNRIYQLMVSRPLKPTYSQEVDAMKFTESFKLI